MVIIASTYQPRSANSAGELAPKGQKVQLRCLNSLICWFYSPTSPKLGSQENAFGKFNHLTKTMLEIIADNCLEVTWNRICWLFTFGCIPFSKWAISPVNSSYIHTYIYICIYVYIIYIYIYVYIYMYIYLCIYIYVYIYIRRIPSVICIICIYMWVRNKLQFVGCTSK